MKVTGHVTRDVSDVIERLASSRGVSVSSVVSELLERAVVARSSEWGESVVVPLLEEVIRREVSVGFNRLARLLVRVGLEAGTARGLAAHVLSTASGMDREKVRRLSDGYWADAVRRLKSPVEDMPELLRALQDAEMRARERTDQAEGT